MCIAAANYLIDETNRYNNAPTTKQRVSMTCKRLQKLLYISDIEYMRKNKGTSMFRDDYYAWPSGPVIPSVYSKFMIYQDGHMVSIKGDFTPITPLMKECLDSVLECTWNMDTWDLVELSHKNDGTEICPWKQFYNENDPNHEQIIRKDAIYAFYQKRNIFEIK